MKERPINLRPHEVASIQSGRQTQLRRIVKPQPYVDGMGNACWNGLNFGQDNRSVPQFQTLASPLPDSKTKRVYCPYGQPGDRLWGRESFAHWPDDEAWLKDRERVEYRATYKHPNELNSDEWPRWRSPIVMPRWASRITLEITGVRVERVQDISEADAQAEGVPLELGKLESSILGAKAKYRSGFVRRWKEINGPGGWDANPWVWVVEFRRLP